MDFPKFSTERDELLFEGVLPLFMHLCLFSTVLTSPGPAFQECTGSCHVHFPTRRQYHPNLRLTDGLTVLARIEIFAILV